MKATPEEELATALAEAKRLVKASRFAEAGAIYRRAMRQAPRHPEVHYAFGVCLQKAEDFEGAAAACAVATRLRPDYAQAHYLAGCVLTHSGDIHKAIAAMRRAVVLQPENVSYHCGLIFLLHFTTDRQALREELRAWNARHAEPLRATWRPHHNSRDPARPLRIGYVTDYLRYHAIACFLHPLLAYHDREHFQVVAYSGTTKVDAVTAQFRAMAAQWRDTDGWSDERLAQAIRDDQIDILVDPTMHMAGYRLLAFARKPAPVQVAWLAYPGSTGIAAMDYRISDRHLDPEDAGDATYSERTVRLPDSFGCYAPLLEEPPVNPLPALRSGGVTFGCCNSFHKVNETSVTLWARVLAAVPQSRMLLQAPAGSAREWAQAIFARQGVAADRLAFVGRLPPLGYRQLFHKVDIALDPFPYGGHTTLCDGLRMGVPGITLVGEMPTARGGLSLLSSAGLRQFVAESEDDYVRIAVETARDLPRLAALRAGLRRHLETTPLMDGRRFAANMEAALREMWGRWCREGA